MIKLRKSRNEVVNSIRRLPPHPGRHRHADLSRHLHGEGRTRPRPTLEELLRPEDEEALSLANFEDEQ